MNDWLTEQEEFFTHCKKNLALTKDSFEAAIDLYQDCTMTNVSSIVVVQLPKPAAV